MARDTCNLFTDTCTIHGQYSGTDEAHNISIFSYINIYFDVFFLNLPLVIFWLGISYGGEVKRKSGGVHVPGLRKEMNKYKNQYLDSQILVQHRIIFPVLYTEPNIFYLYLPSFVFFRAMQVMCTHLFFMINVSNSHCLF